MGTHQEGAGFPNTPTRCVPWVSGPSYGNARDREYLRESARSRQCLRMPARSASGNKSLLAVGVSAAALAGLSAGPAVAGHRTPAVANARSGCAANGLNDMNPDQGQITLIVQNYGANKKLNLDPALFGFPGTGSNPTRG